jgi:hypothetical protein
MYSKLTKRKKMKKLNLLMVGILSVFLIGCGGGESKSSTPDTNSKVKYINISDADSVIIGSQTTSSVANLSLPQRILHSIKTFSFATPLYANTTTTKVFKLTDEGAVEEITFKDENNETVTQINYPYFVSSIDDKSILVVFGIDGSNIDSSYIVNKTTDEVYELENTLVSPVNGFANRKFFKLDAAGNIYLLQKISSDAGLLHRRLLKVSYTSEGFSEQLITPELDGIKNYEVDNDGNIIYYAEEVNNIGNYYSKILTVDTNLTHTIDRTYILWKGKDNNFYTKPDGVSDKYKKYTISTGGVINVSDVTLNGGYSCAISESSYLIDMNSTVLTNDYTNHTICELYNPAVNPREFNTSLSSISHIDYSDNYYYIYGQNGLTGELRRYNPSDDTFVDLLSSVNYTINTFSVTKDDIVKFNGVRTSDNQKIIGDINNSTITIIDENSNITATVIEDI